jgi:predicted O-methyltransferase YrrM
MTHAQAVAGISISEGSISAKEADYLASLVKCIDSPSPLIVQTGLGLGWSAWAFLSANPLCRVVSFDLGAHLAIAQVADVLARAFPDRHSLIVGDSKISVPRNAHRFEGANIAFVDGGHDYETAAADLRNLAKPGRVVVIDDCVEAAWAAGVTRAWDEALKRGQIVETGVYRDGAHGWAAGVYAWVTAPRYLEGT